MCLESVIEGANIRLQDTPSAILIRCVMKKYYRHVGFLVSTFTILGVLVYGLFWLRQLYTHSHRLDKAFIRIVDTLSEDPNYIVTEDVLIKAIEPDPMDWSASLEYENQVLQVCVRKAAKGGRPGWPAPRGRLFRYLPGFLRRYRIFSTIHTLEATYIEITAVEPHGVEFQVLKDKVSSLGLSRDLRTVLSPYFPKRQHNQRVQGTSYLGP